jgi:dimethylglycine dehydrogenase
VSRIGAQRFLLLGADTMQLAFMRHFAPYLPAEGVELTNLSATYGGLHICGPNARELISRLAEHDMDSANFPFMSASEMSVGDIEQVLLLRVSFTGETGYEMYLPMERQLALFDLLHGEGENLGLGLVGTRCLMQTRLEKNFPAWALELCADYTPAEAELDRFVKADKGDFIGRDAFMQTAAPREKFASFTVDAGDCVVWGDEAIFLDNEPVGYVTSGGFGPACEQHIALGYVNCDAYRPAGQYAVEILGQLRAAQLQVDPLYDPTGSKMRT